MPSRIPCSVPSRAQGCPMKQRCLLRGVRVRTEVARERLEAEKLLKESSGEGKAVYPGPSGHFGCGIASRCLEGGGKRLGWKRGGLGRKTQRPVPECCCTELGPRDQLMCHKPSKETEAAIVVHPPDSEPTSHLTTSLPLPLVKQILPSSKLSWFQVQSDSAS